jgi:hypothetical protein
MKKRPAGIVASDFRVPTPQKRFLAAAAAAAAAAATAAAGYNEVMKNL